MVVVGRWCGDGNGGEMVVVERWCVDGSGGEMVGMGRSGEVEGHRGVAGEINNDQISL